MSGATIDPNSRRLLDDFSWWQRVRMTPLSDVLRGELSARLSLAYTIDQANLPAPLPGLILQLIRRTRLWHREKLEVARELIAHFQDGLDSGASPEQLAKDFGDIQQAAKLIRRAKNRQRPLWWRTSRRGVQAVLLLPVVLILLYVPIAIRFFAGSPTISHDYLADLNKTAASVPLDQRAWPVYREALIGLPQVQLIADGKVHPAGVKPADAEWPEFETYITKHADRLAMIRRAAAMPGLGFEASRRLTAEDQKLWPEMVPQQTPVDAGLFTVLMPYLGEMRKIGQLLAMDARRAAATEEAALVVDDLIALMGVARHTRENPLLIGDLISLALFHMMLDCLGKFLDEQPHLFSDQQLQELAHRIASFTDRDLRINLDGERLSFRDIIQRTYTDDGNGNGRMTAKGMKLLESMVTRPDGSSGMLDERFLSGAAQPAMSMLILDRRDMLAEYDRLMDEVQIDGDRPLWQRQGTPLNNLLATWQASPLHRTRYLLLVLLAPAIEHATVQSHYVCASRDGILIAIALELHRRRHGAWPQSLDELAPTQMPAVPIDPYDGKMMKYALCNGKPVVYSIGNDRDDDGGRPPEPEIGPHMSDPKRWIAAGIRSNIRVDADWILWPPVPDAPKP